MIAAFPMYDRLELHSANDRLWTLVRERLQSTGIDAPDKLTRNQDELSIWENPELVLAQTCGLPFRQHLRDKVTLVGTPDYAVLGCEPGYYRSAFVIRKDDTRNRLVEFTDAVFAYNQKVSQSGFAAAYTHCTGLGFWFENFLQTGQHSKSAFCVFSGQADIACIDAVSWRHMDKHDDFTSNMRVLTWTEPTPGLPLITAREDKVEEIFQAVKSGIQNLESEHRKTLGIHDIVKIPKAEYLSVPNPPELPSMYRQ